MYISCFWCTIYVFEMVWLKPAKTQCAVMCMLWTPSVQKDGGNLSALSGLLVCGHLEVSRLKVKRSSFDAKLCSRISPTWGLKFQFIFVVENWPLKSCPIWHIKVANRKPVGVPPQLWTPGALGPKSKKNVNENSGDYVVRTSLKTA